MEEQFYTEKEVPFFKTALRVGLIGAMILIAITLVQNIFELNIETMHTILFGLLSIVVYVFISRMGVLTHREDDLGGHISFGRALTVGLIACMIAGFIQGIFGILYMHYIDPSVLQAVMDRTRDQYEARGMSDEQIDQAINMVKLMTGPGVGIVTALLSATFIGLLVSLPVAYIMKKDAPV